MSNERSTLRRRLDLWSLRTQARLDTERVDRIAPWIAAGLVVVILALMALAVIRQGDGGPGLTMWIQAIWNAEATGTTFATVAGGDPVLDQWAFVAYPLVLAARVAPTAELLAIAQALVLGVAIVPLWRICRDRFALRLGTSAAVVGAYALAPAVHAVNLAPFHPETAAVPAIAWSVVFRYREAWVRYWACIALVLVCRADMGLVVVALGLVAYLAGHRPQGIVTAAVGLAWTSAAVSILDPQLPTGMLSAAETFLAQGTVPLAEIRATLTDPGRLIGDLFARESLPVLVALFAPLLFLSFASPRTLIPAIPPIVYGLAADASFDGVLEPAASLGNLSTSVLVAVIPIGIAATGSLNRIGRLGTSRVAIDHRIIASVVIASVILFAQYAPTSPYQQPWGWGSRGPVDAAREEAAGRITDREPVTVSPQVGNLVADRATVKETTLGPPEDAGAARPDTPAVILDTTAGEATGEPLWTSAERKRIIEDLVDAGYEVDYRQQGIILLVR